jgi:cephalosporin hydroxylase
MPLPRVTRNHDVGKRSGTLVKSIRRLVKPVLGPVWIRGAIPSLRLAVRRADGLDDLLDVAYEFNFAGIRIAPWQIRSEIRGLLETLQPTQPRLALEIGTEGGGSLFLLAQVAAEDATLISVDIPQGEFGDGYPRWRAPLYRSFATRQQRIELLRADSHDPQTLTSVKSLLHGRPLDFLFIDGDHTREGVEADFEMYSPLVKEGGLIAFHDIVPSAAGVSADQGERDGSAPTYWSGDVPAFWQALKQGYAVREFVADRTQQAYGIGLLTYHRPPARL